ncbi:collagen alpha-1(XI) chain-like [Bufo bufo]|uniref:collagen alpha-1(XI) chain-like n=1 Tax=Bufo bufo TaxID=8384 RepID=UPI001ABE96C3|nr:collagen alpha-1(XI) chain-like [Bufo bufo]
MDMTRGHCQLAPLLFLVALVWAGSLELEDSWEAGSGQMAEEVNVLESLTLQSAELVNISLSSEHSCLSLDMGQYSTLSISTRAAFGDSFADELAVLIKLRSTLQENTGLITILSLHGQVLFQIRISPSALIFISSRRGHYEFPVPSLTDGKWHRVALGISSKSVTLYVDCKLVEKLPWSNFFGLGVKTDGILMLGGLIEPYDIPFKGSLQQLVFVMGVAGAAQHYCRNYNQTCLSSFPAENVFNASQRDNSPRHSLVSKFNVGETSTSGVRNNSSTHSAVEEGVAITDYFTRQG